VISRLALRSILVLSVPTGSFILPELLTCRGGNGWSPSRGGDASG
jgi:hypothetical protein